MKGMEQIIRQSLLSRSIRKVSLEYSSEMLEKTLFILSSLFIYCPLSVPRQLIWGTLICVVSLYVMRKTRPLLTYLNAAYVLAEWILTALDAQGISLGYASVFVTLGVTAAVFASRGNFQGWFSFEKIPAMGFLYLTLSCAALIIYGMVFAEATPHLLDLVVPFKSLPVVLIPLCGVFLASINAFWEEMLFRGFYTESLRKYPLLVWVLPSVLFGLMHYQNGFPKGLIGVALTTIFGLMMTHIRLTTRSLLPGILIHTVCDSTIFMVLVMA